MRPERAWRRWRRGTSETSGATGRVPDSMSPVSSRSPIRPRMCLACAMMRSAAARFRRAARGPAWSAPPSGWCRTRHGSAGRWSACEGCARRGRRVGAVRAREGRLHRCRAGPQGAAGAVLRRHGPARRGSRADAARARPGGCGASRTARSAASANHAQRLNLRFVAATNRTLAAEAAGGRFHENLHAGRATAGPS